MDINFYSEECKFTLTGQHNEAELQLKVSFIQHIDSIKDLVTVSCKNLTWDEHIKHCTAKASKVKFWKRNVLQGQMSPDISSI